MPLPIAPSATSSALSGIRSASNRVDAAAANVVSSMTGAGVRGEDTVSISPQARFAAGATGGSGDLPGSVVDMRVAKYQNAASISVLRTADEMTEELVKLGKQR